MERDSRYFETVLLAIEYPFFSNNSHNNSSIYGFVLSSELIISSNVIFISLVEIFSPLSFVKASEKSSFNRNDYALTPIFNFSDKILTPTLLISPVCALNLR